MAWNDIREYVERQFRIEFEATIKVDLPGQTLRTPAGRRLAIEAIESEVHAFCAHLGQTVSAARDTLQKYAKVADPNAQILPWLPAGHGRDDRVVVTQQVHLLLQRFDTNMPLAGQRSADSITPAAISVSAYHRYETKPLFVDIDVVELSDGSLRGFVKGALQATTLTVTLMLAAFATPAGQGAYEQWQFNREIHQTIQGQECSYKATWSVDLKALQERGIRQLNFAEPGISDAERTLRVCNVQLILAAVQGSPASIDGKPGKNTMEALRAFAEQHHLECDIRREDIRNSLLWEYKFAARR